ncbi:MAG: AlkZ-related protein [Anaerolineales bacterium]
MTTLECLNEHRKSTFRITCPITSLHEAIQYIQERGFVFFWPIKEIIFPSLWVAVAGNRPVPNQHDDPAHITWNWKDSMLDKKIWYYAKILRRKSTILSLEIAPYFYALSDNYGDPEEEYLTAYLQGKLSIEAKQIYQAILENGPLDTIHLKQKAHLTNPNYESRFNTALANLQADFKIVPIGVSESGPWHYAFVYDLTHRQFPEIIENARWISQQQARQEILIRYFQSMGYAKWEWIQKLFLWNSADIATTLEKLLQRNILYKQIFSGIAGEWYVLAEINC